MSTIDVKNAVAIDVDGKTIPMFVNPQGHMRFMHIKHNNGTFSFVICCSDKKIDDITKEHVREETWENQTVEPVFAIHFESIEQIDAYIRALNHYRDRVKNM